MNIFSFDNTFEGLLTLVFEMLQPESSFPMKSFQEKEARSVLFGSTVDIAD